MFNIHEVLKVFTISIAARLFFSRKRKKDSCRGVSREKNKNLRKRWKMSYPSYHFSNGPSLKAVAWSVVEGVDKSTPSHQQES